MIVKSLIARYMRSGEQNEIMNKNKENEKGKRQQPEHEMQKRERNITIKIKLSVRKLSIIIDLLLLKEIFNLHSFAVYYLTLLL